MKPSEDSTPARADRREFLAWLLAAPALAGCTVAASDDAANATGVPVEPGAAASNEGHAEDEPDVAMTEAQWRSCSATTRDAEGPYFEPGSPPRGVRLADLEERGIPLRLEGRLFGPDCRRPLAGYAIDVWQADATGNYFSATGSSYRLRGKITTDALGRYRFETILPARYTDGGGTRPAHLHWKILTPQGNTLLTTQLYFAGDPFLGAADYCTRSRTCNSADPRRALTLADALVSGKPGKRATFDAFLSRS